MATSSADARLIASAIEANTRELTKVHQALTKIGRSVKPTPLVPIPDLDPPEYDQPK